MKNCNAVAGDNDNDTHNNCKLKSIFNYKKNIKEQLKQLKINQSKNKNKELKIKFNQIKILKVLDYLRRKIYVLYTKKICATFCTSKTKIYNTN